MLKIFHKNPKKIRKLVLAGTVCALVASGVSVYAWYENQRPPFLEIYVFALKSGQAIFIRTPSDQRILIDGGTNSEVIRHISSVLPFYYRRIDKVIVTKTDGKHSSGLVDVLNRYSVGEVIVPGTDLKSLDLASSTDQIYETFLNTANEMKIPVRQMVFGDDFVVDEIKFEALFPVVSSSFKYSKASGPELVLRIVHGSTSVLVAGSITSKIQKFIATSTRIKSDVLVLSQNASTANVSRIFMSGVAPSYLIHSKQKPKKENIDPFPDIPEVNRFNIREFGDVRIVLDGSRIISIQRP